MWKYLTVPMIAGAALAVILTLADREPTGPAPAIANSGPGDPTASSAQAVGRSGKVLETMNAGGYTYVKIEAPDGAVWVAGPETTVAVGDQVSMSQGMAMRDFHSDSLDRTFEVVYFVPAINVNGDSDHPARPFAGHPDISGSGTANAADLDFGDIEPAKKGRTIAAIISDRKGLGGKQVTVRGKVVKFTPNVMGRNWIHIQDGTGASGANDLTVTCDQTVNVGDTVLVVGTVAIDQDFGYGYSYPILVEKASVTVEASS